MLEKDGWKQKVVEERGCHGLCDRVRSSEVKKEDMVEVGILRTGCWI